jgi:hypothetical protein
MPLMRARDGLSLSFYSFKEQDYIINTRSSLSLLSYYYYSITNLLLTCYYLYRRWVSIENEVKRQLPYKTRPLKQQET